MKGEMGAQVEAAKVFFFFFINVNGKFSFSFLFTRKLQLRTTHVDDDLLHSTNPQFECMKPPLELSNVKFIISHIAWFLLDV